MTYQEKLKDPRWQKKRLEILERDEWCCKKCFATESTLQIHHRYYKKGDPWDYPDKALITLCEDCHKDEKLRASHERCLLFALKERFFEDAILSLASGFANMPLHHSQEVVADVYEWALSDSKIQKELIKRFFQHLKAKNATA